MWRYCASYFITDFQGGIISQGTLGLVLLPIWIAFIVWRCVWKHCVLQICNVKQHYQLCRQCRREGMWKETAFCNVVKRSMLKTTQFCPLALLSDACFRQCLKQKYKYMCNMLKHDLLSKCVYCFGSRTALNNQLYFNTLSGPCVLQLCKQFPWCQWTSWGSKQNFHMSFTDTCT